MAPTPLRNSLTLRGLILCHNIVYIHHRNNEVLYIGMSNKGLRRPFEHLSIQETDAIEIYPCAVSREARELEKKLISKYKPINNIKLYDDKQPYIPAFTRVTLLAMSRGSLGKQWEEGRHTGKQQSSIMVATKASRKRSMGRRDIWPTETNCTKS